MNKPIFPKNPRPWLWTLPKCNPFAPNCNPFGTKLCWDNSTNCSWGWAVNWLTLNKRTIEF